MWSRKLGLDKQKREAETSRRRTDMSTAARIKRTERASGKAAYYAGGTEADAWARSSVDVELTERSSVLSAVGFTMFLALMAFPFVVQYIPQGIRQYLSASFR
jgi:hypothetical protein